MELLKPRQIIESKIIPIWLRQLMKLINNGELKKKKELRDWINYIIGSNIGIWEKQATWVVEQGEITAWLERAKK